MLSCQGHVTAVPFMHVYRRETRRLLIFMTGYSTVATCIPSCTIPLPLLRMSRTTCTQVYNTETTSNAISLPRPVRTQIYMQLLDTIVLLQAVMSEAGAENGRTSRKIWSVPCECVWRSPTYPTTWCQLEPAKLVPV